MCVCHRAIDCIKRKTNYTPLSTLKEQSVVNALPPKQFMFGMILESEMLIFCANEQNSEKYIPPLTLINVHRQ